ncbi:cell adhesion molecule CEACAM1-like isoform X2 [Phyllobates terribilis]|uniref:cell adhesion molecule CEACAM1-like isoform X2 n=1 Tax=Phyllobates terribilis TaxID=111132 RepID=UPI003CCACFE5
MRRFLITVLLVITMDVTSGQISIQQIPEHPVINGSVTLSITGITDKLQHVMWYKGPSITPPYQILTYFPANPALIPGLLYNDRISAFNNGSLQIRDLRDTDGGKYIAQIQMDASAKFVDVTLTIYEPVTKPKITASVAQPKENDPFTLICGTSHATNISWTKRDMTISSKTKLYGDNRTLMFSSVKREDSGEYRCEAQNIASKDVSDPHTVSIAYGPDEIEIAGPALVMPGSPNTLTCSADSQPPPEFQWKVNGVDLEGNTSKYVVSNAIAEYEGLYTCVVRNPMTLRSLTASVYVNMTAESSENRQNQITVYENVTEPQSKEESSYMGLQCRTEDTYTELKA